MSFSQTNHQQENLQALSGTAFENLCCLLLKQIGFFVETTSITGDGGIDLIAISDAPFFKGKYIVQCKRYKGSVGVAFVRDLYGVVTDEKANKGILITTGYFSTSAIDFAAGKNIELIDGEHLRTLLYEYGLSANMAENAPMFINNPVFNRNKYDFYKGMIAQNQCTQAMGRDFLFSFMFGYLLNDTNNSGEKYLPIIHNGFADEYKRLFDWYVGKYYQKGKKELALLPYYVRKYYGLAELYSFDLFDFVQKRYEILKYPRWFSIQTNLENPDSSYMKTYYLEDIPEAIKSPLGAALLRRDWNKVKYVCRSSYYEVQTLYSIFKYFGITKGELYISRKLLPLKDPSRRLLHTLVFVNAPGHDVATQNAVVFIPEIKYIDAGKYSRVDAHFNPSTWVNMNPYFDKYSKDHTDKIHAEIQKINSLFDALNSD